MLLAKKHVQANPIPPHQLCEDLPKKVSDVIMKALSKKPEQRQQSALELARELRAAAGLVEDEDALTSNLKRLNPATSGLNGTVIKSHGGADILAFECAIFEALSEAQHQVPEHIGGELLGLLGTGQVA